MRFTKRVVLLLSFFLVSTDAFAETVTGCRLGNNNFLYTRDRGIKKYKVSKWDVREFRTYSSPNKPFLEEWYDTTNNCPQFVGNPIYGAQCAIQGITVVSGGTVENLGNTITYTITYQCPIDKEVAVLLVTTGMLSAYFIRRNYCS